MCSMAFRWLARRLLDSFRSPMMCSIARRCSSRWRRRRSSVSTCARSSLAAAPDSGTVGWRSSVTLSGIAMRPSALSASRLLPQALQLLLEGDHLQLAADNHFLEFLEVQNLLLQLALGLFQVPHHLFVRAHVAQDTDGADDPAVRVAQGGGVEGGRDDLAARAAGIEARVAGDAPRYDFPQRRRELPGLLGADEARERLFEHLVLAEAEELGDRVVGLEDLPFEIGDEDGVRSVLDQALRVGPGLVQLAHVAQDADGADDPAVGVAQGGGVEGGGDHLTAGALGVEAGVAGDTPLHHLPESGQELSGFIGSDEARERLLDHLVRAEAEELGDGVVGLEDLALEVGDEDRVRGVGDDDVGIQRAAPFGAPAVTFGHVRLRHELGSSSHFGSSSRTGGATVGRPRAITESTAPVAIVCLGAIAVFHERPASRPPAMTGQLPQAVSGKAPISDRECLSGRGACQVTKASRRSALTALPRRFAYPSRGWPLPR